MGNEKIKVLYYSNMTASPGSGGGNTVYNLLEPNPENADVYYATPSYHLPHYAPFPELGSRLCWLANQEVVHPLAGNGILAQQGNRAIFHANRALVERNVMKGLNQYVKDLRPDVLLVCPQSEIRTTTKLVNSTNLPIITWFMDNYYTDEKSSSAVASLCAKSEAVFVVSEAMHSFFRETYGRDCQVLNNSVPFSENHSEPEMKSDKVLRIAYTGATHEYYHDSLISFISGLKGLGERVQFDIYSHEKVNSEAYPETDYPLRFLPPVPGTDLINHLREYDVLLMLSSFKPGYRAIAETSLASKTADYLASGRCILFYGPEYAENIRYAERYGFGEVVTSENSGHLREAVLSLAADAERRRKLGRRAFEFGRERHDLSKNRAKLWQAIFQASVRKNAKGN